MEVSVYALLRAVLLFFGVRPADGIVGCVITPKFDHLVKWWGATVVIAIIVVLVVRGHAVEVFETLTAAWLVDVLDMVIRRPEVSGEGRPVVTPEVS